MSERELLAAVVEVARLLGYLVHHTRPAMTGRGWRTPLQGQAGFPDVVIVGRGRVLFRELKVDRNKLTPGQEAWIAALEEAGADVGLWTDADWQAGRVEEALR